MPFAAIPDLVIGLGLLAGFLAAYGTLYGYNYSLGAALRGIAWFLSNLRVNVWFVSVNVGDWLAREFRKLDHAIQNVLGAWVAQMDSALGRFLHANALLFERLARFIEGVPADVAMLGEWVTHHAIPTLVRESLKPIRAQIEQARKLVASVRHDALVLKRDIAAERKTFTHSLSRAIAHEQAWVGSRLDRLLRDGRSLRARVHEIEKLLTVAGAVGLVTLALRKMGLNWLRCPALARVGSKIGCGGFGFIEALLAESFEALVVLDLCRFAVGAQKLAKIVVPQLGAVLLVQDAICLGGGASLPSAVTKPKALRTITRASALD